MRCSLAREMRDRTHIHMHEKIIKLRCLVQKHTATLHVLLLNPLAKKKVIPNKQSLFTQKLRTGQNTAGK